MIEYCKTLSDAGKIQAVILAVFILLPLAFLLIRALVLGIARELDSDDVVNGLKIMLASTIICAIILACTNMKGKEYSLWNFYADTNNLNNNGYILLEATGRHPIIDSFDDGNSDYIVIESNSVNIMAIFSYWQYGSTYNRVSKAMRFEDKNGTTEMITQKERYYSHYVPVTYYSFDDIDQAIAFINKKINGGVTDNIIIGGQEET